MDGILNAQRYHDEILRPVVESFIWHHHHLMFDHDIEGPHVARICTQFLEAENVLVLLWPAYSPDMSPIEHVWDALDRRERQRVPVPDNIQQLCTAIEEEWNNISQATNQHPDQLYVKEMCHAAWWSHQIPTGFLIHTPTFFKKRYLWPTDAYQIKSNLICNIHMVSRC